MKLTIYVILQMLIFITAYDPIKDFDCSKLQFWNRDKRIKTKPCNESDIYHCAWDLFSNQHRDICWLKRILIRKGKRPTIQGGLHFGNCPSDRYQPFPVISNETVDCWYKKSYCKEEGQLVCNDTSGETDIKCRCDYTDGYAFVHTPKHIYYCTPAEEDCSCFQKSCDNEDEQLVADYSCVSIYNNTISYESNFCQPFRFNDSVKDDRLSKADQKTVSDKENGVIVVWVTLIVFGVLYALLFLLIFIRCPFRIVTRNKSSNHTKEGEDAEIQFYIKGLPVIGEEKWLHKDNFINLVKKKKYSSSITKISCIKYLVTLTVHCVDENDEGKYILQVYSSVRPIRLTHLLPDGYVYSRKGSFTLHVKTKRSTTKIEKHKKDDTFYCTSAVTEACNLLDSCNVLALIGHKNCGKSKACNEIAKLYKERGFDVLHFSVIDDIVEFAADDRSELYIVDINMNPNLNKKEEEILLERITEIGDFKETNLKCVFTVTTTIRNKWLPNFPTKQQVRVDLFTKKDKEEILIHHMNARNIHICNNYYESNIEDPAILSDDTSQVLIYQKVIEDIVNAETVVGFPKYCKTFCSNRSLLRLEDRYFKNPLRSVVKDISQLRSKNETKLQYVALAYILINNQLDRKVDEKILQDICEKMKINSCQNFDIRDAAIALEHVEDKYLMDNEGVYIFINQMIKRAVWMSYIDIDYSYCVMNCPWEYVTDLLRPESWPNQENEVCIPADTNALCNRLISEMADVGKAWSVGTYLYKVCEHGKELLETFSKSCSTHVNNKPDVLFSLFLALSNSGMDDKLFKMCTSLSDLLKRPIDRSANCLLHYCVLYEYDFIFTTDRVGMFLCSRNDNKYSPCDLAFYLGRSKITEKYSKEIPEEYGVFEKLKEMHSLGGKVSGKPIHSLKKFGIDLLNGVSKKLKFGNKKDYQKIDNFLTNLKNKTMLVIRVKGIPFKVNDEDIRNVLSTLNCIVMTFSLATYRFKNQPKDSITGDRVVVCSFSCQDLPFTVRFGADKVTTATMMMLTIRNLPTSIQDHQVKNALSLQNYKVLEIQKIISKEAVVTEHSTVEYIAFCTKTDPVKLEVELMDQETEDIKTETESTNPETESINEPIKSETEVIKPGTETTEIKTDPKVQETLTVEQYIGSVETNTLILLRNISKSVSNDEIRKFLWDKNQIKVESVYREEKMNETDEPSILKHIPTGDRVAICKPLSQPLPPSIKIGEYVAELEIESPVTNLKGSKNQDNKKKVASKLPLKT